MNFLKKLGAVLAQSVGIVTGFAPAIAALNPRAGEIVQVATGEMTLVAGVIGTVESIGQSLQLKGAQKLEAAAPLVAQVILASSLMVGKTIADPDKFNAAVKGIASNFADLLSSLHEKSVNVETKN